MGDPDGHDASERVDSPYPRPPQAEAPIVRSRQLGWALSCIIWYPIVSVLLLAVEVSVAVAVAVASPLIIAYYCAAAFGRWFLRIGAFLSVLCICWLVSDSLLRVIYQSR